METLAQLIHSIRVGTPITSGNLTMFPLLSDVSVSAAADYLLLDEALAGAQAEVTEVSQSGSVPSLRFSNRSSADILLLDGEELVGAKQNRVLNLTMLVAAGQELNIPVSCVEAGRWAWRTKKFAASGKKLHARARAEKARRVSHSLEQSASRVDSSIQCAIWEQIDAKICALNSRSETGALNDVYAAFEEKLATQRSAFQALAYQVGAAFAIGSNLCGLDIYDRPQTLRSVLPKLVDSYAIDAMEEIGDAGTPSPSLTEVQDLIARLSKCSVQAYTALAKGMDLRLEGEGVHAAALVADGRIAHLAAFTARA